jgi:hypothetical protein
MIGEPSTCNLYVFFSFVSYSRFHFNTTFIQKMNSIFLEKSEAKCWKMLQYQVTKVNTGVGWFLTFMKNLGFQFLTGV